jgi:hypothetical protein
MAGAGEMRRHRATFLFSPKEDVIGFLLPALVPLALCPILDATGALSRPVTPLLFLLAVVLVDVAHVYATAYRVYADPQELRRRPLLYVLVPLACYFVGVLLYSGGALRFWRALAYLAIFHFVRQQYGWVALSRRRDPPSSSPRLRRLDRILDDVAIYLGTLYPLLYWHTHLPRAFSWFIRGDLAQGLPRWLLAIAAPIYFTVGALWLVRFVWRSSAARSWNLAKLLVMTGTWATWYVGIVAYNSDVAFTLCNVLPHGIPYLVLVFRYWRSRRAEASALVPDRARRAILGAALLFYLPLILGAWLEEAVWDRLVWHEHGMLFPFAPTQLTEVALLLLVPLLALPQATHYALDAWIWRSGAQNPDLPRRIGLG